MRAASGVTAKAELRGIRSKNKEEHGQPKLSPKKPAQVRPGSNPTAVLLISVVAFIIIWDTHYNHLGHPPARQ